MLFSGQRAINYCTEKLNPVAAIANAKIIDAKEDMILAANSLSVVEVNRVANTLIRRIKYIFFQIDPDIAAAENLRKWFSCQDDNKEDEGSPTMKIRSD